MNTTNLPRTPGVYLIRNLVNGKVYIGSSCDIRRRVTEHVYHLCCGDHKNRHLLSAWLLYGSRAFEPEVLWESDSNDISDRLHNELAYILSYGSFDGSYGYNLSPPATGGTSSLRDEVRQKMSAARTGRKQSPETVAKRIAKVTGQRRSEAVRANLREIAQLHAADPAWRTKVRDGLLRWNQENERSEEHRRRYSATMRARTHCKRGHEFTEENTYVTSTGFRQCRECNRARYLAYYRRKQAELQCQL